MTPVARGVDPPLGLTLTWCSVFMLQRRSIDLVVRRCWLCDIWKTRRIRPPDERRMASLAPDPTLKRLGGLIWLMLFIGLDLALHDGWLLRPVNASLLGVYWAARCGPTAGAMLFGRRWMTLVLANCGEGGIQQYVHPLVSLYYYVACICINSVVLLLWIICLRAYIIRKKYKGHIFESRKLIIFDVWKIFTARQWLIS